MRQVAISATHAKPATETSAPLKSSPVPRSVATGSGSRFDTGAKRSDEETPMNLVFGFIRSDARQLVPAREAPWPRLH